MPTYEYECTKCGHRYEKFQQMTADRDKTCPECGKSVKRLIGAGAGFIMKSSAKAACPAQSACSAKAPCCGGDVPCPKFS